MTTKYQGSFSAPRQDIPIIASLQEGERWNGILKADRASSNMG